MSSAAVILGMHEGDRVRFRIVDSYLPPAAQVLEALDEQSEVIGTLVGLSDSGTAPGLFGVVEMTGARTVVVELRNLKPIGGFRSDAGANDESPGAA